MTLQENLEGLSQNSTRKKTVGTMIFLVVVISVIAGLAIMYVSIPLVGEGGLKIEIRDFLTIEGAGAFLVVFVIGAILVILPIVIMIKSLTKIVLFEPPSTFGNWVTHHDLFS